MKSFSYVAALAVLLTFGSIERANALIYDKLSPTSRYACIIGGKKNLLGSASASGYKVISFEKGENALVKEREGIKTRRKRVSDIAKKIRKDIATEGVLAQFSRLVSEILGTNQNNFTNTPQRLAALDSMNTILAGQIVERNQQIAALRNCKKGKHSSPEAAPVTVAKATDHNGYSTIAVFAQLALASVGEGIYCINGKKADGTPYFAQRAFVSDPCAVVTFSNGSCKLPDNLGGALIYSYSNVGAQGAELDALIADITAQWAGTASLAPLGSCK